MDTWDYTHALQVAIERIGSRSDLYSIILSLGSVRATSEVVDCTIQAHMSPQTAKALHMILERQLRDYEAKFGAIPRDTSLEHTLGLHEE